MTLGELIQALGGKLVCGHAHALIRAVNASALAGPSDLVFAEDSAAAADAVTGRAGAVVLRAGMLASYPASMAVVETPQPRLWFARAARLLSPRPSSTGIHPSAVVGAGVSLPPDVSVGPCAVIGNGASIGPGTRVEAGAIIGQGVCIGRDCLIHPRVVLYPGTTLGDRVVLHAGVVLGADGFGFVRDAETGAYTQFPQQGTLLIEDDVEIGANSTVDRGALQQTRIGRGTKIDNLVHVGHNCEIGENVILVALTGISGSSKVGDGAILAGQVGIGDHVTVGPGVILGGQSGVFNGKTLTNDGVKPGTVFFGTPARPLAQVMRETAVLGRLARSARKTPQNRQE